MSLPPDRIGDHGQRFEISALDLETGEESLIGWSDRPMAFHKAILLMPRWRERRVPDSYPMPDHIPARFTDRPVRQWTVAERT